ncbi:MAG TPA: single-stranded DNA-binding protein [Verrucomicrobiota bacterium]|nr:single-stranded DNA-binding protein [Verrucomicrobiota bacterium]
MASYNKVILLGNLTRDPELRYTAKGTAVARLGLAVNRTYKTDSGESKEEVTFVDVDAWGKQAELISQYLRKGSPLFMEGRLKLDQWDDKQTGQKRSTLRVVLEAFQFVGGRGEGGGSGGSGPSSPPSRPAAKTAAPPAPAAGEPSSDGPPPEEDDVPF